MSAGLRPRWISAATKLVGPLNPGPAHKARPVSGRSYSTSLTPPRVAAGASSRMKIETLTVDFTDEQKRYLEGFTTGLQVSRVGRGLGGGNAGKTNAEPTGPDAAHIKAQDKVIASGKKLADQEKFKREEHPFDVYPRLKQQALTNAPPSAADNIRNVTGTPTAGIDPQELIDTREYAREWHYHILNDRSLTGLPRKFNVAFDGAGKIAVLEDTNDIAFSAVEVKDSFGVEPGVWFKLGIGGITGHRDFAADTGIIVKPADATKVADAIVRVFVDTGDRTNRLKARLKYVLDSMGVEKFLIAVEEKLGLAVQASQIRAGLIACTGNAGCKFAASDTKRHAAEIGDWCETRVAIETPLNIHLTGCHHSCAQHYISDIGLLAAKVPAGSDDDTVEGYHLYAGGGFGPDADIGQEVYRDVKAEDAPKTVERLLKAYLTNRASADETFLTFSRRHDGEALRKLAEAEATP